MGLNKHKALLAIDFDKTIADSDYPHIHNLRPNAKEVLNRLHEEGFYIIINTCRSDGYEEEVRQYLNSQEVKYHHVNTNHPGLCEYYKADSRKISADIYIDDKSLETLLDPETCLNWINIYNNIQKVISMPTFLSILNSL